MQLRNCTELTNFIWVTFRKEAIHRYPAAGTDPNLADVSFLAFPHRHILHFKVGISVHHNDRDVEFIQFKRWLESLYSDQVLELDYKSMEMIADDLAVAIYDKYSDDRLVTIEVSEDGENGTLKQYKGA